MSIVDVSVAIITDTSKRFLVTRRAFDISHGGFWEMPGGKVEPNETPYDALVREIQEEVGLQVQSAELIGQIKHTYPDKKVRLHVFQVLQYEGTASCNDGQLALQWASREVIDTLQFPEANTAILQLVEAYIPQQEKFQAT
ncbi:MAG: 8-oxo-dGTP diphosphatase MutT [Legionellaceae bacterium]|nr:8-oxo-dGTP diphosphatase MutT [Legionellaceae bacterium]